MRVVGDALEPSTITTTARDGDHEVRVAVGRHATGGTQQHVESLARHETAQAEHHQRVRRQAEATAHVAALRVGQGTETLDIDTRRDVGRRKGTPRSPLGFSQWVAPGGDHDARATQHATKGAVRAGNAPGHGDLRAVEHDAVAVSQAQADEPYRQRGIEHDDLRTDFVRQRVDVSSDPPCRPQDLVLHPLHAEGLFAIPLARAAVRRGEHRRSLRRQSAPQLPQVRLNAAELRREVVGDEEILTHARAATRCAAHSACERNIGSGSRR